MKNLITISILFFLSIQLNAQGLKGLVNKAADIKKEVLGTGTGLSAEEIAAGLKEALNKGTYKATEALAKPDGFYKNAAYKILMPPEVQKVEATLRKIGLGKLADDFILSMNRAAEDAVSTAGPIFIQAIKEMTIQDGIKILRGRENEATEYLKSKTSEQIRAKFSPIIQASLEKTKTLDYWDKIAKAYNAVPFGQKTVDPDLVGYVTQKGLDGIFSEVAAEKKAIRTNPAARTTEILKKTFGL